MGNEMELKIRTLKLVFYINNKLLTIILYNIKSIENNALRYNNSF